MPDSRELIHAYGVLDPGADVPDWPPGVADAPVETLAVSPVVAMTSVLPADEFEPAAWEQHADDPTWLGSVAAGHHRVLQAAVAAGDVVPFRLPSLYGDHDALRRAMSDHAASITQAMERIRGRVEWAVKLYRSDEPDEADPKTGSARTGSDYLIGRSRQMQARAEADALVEDRVRSLYDRVRQTSVAAVRNPPQDRLLSGRGEPMVLNAAFLVERTDLADWQARIDEIAHQAGSFGLTAEASGPWPAYNFASLASADAVAGPA
jgi:gas vesicle protein GvpL/GvpF